jgi:prolyl oligopeptidase
MLTQHPELFHAAIAAVPVLDLLRPDLLSYGGGEVGAAIFGSLHDPAERSFMEKTSPYQNLGYTRNFPAPLLVTSTQDISVYPAHARRFAAKLDSLGMPFYFYETAEGGHQVYATAQQEAEYEALLFTYLAKRLM